MVSVDSPIDPARLPEPIARRWQLFIVLGVALAVLGVFAMGASVVTTLVSVMVFGWALLVAGLLQLGHAIYQSDWRGRTLDIVTGVLFLVVGALVVWRPVMSAVTLTLILAVTLVVRGAATAITAVAHRYPQWAWSVAYGLVSIVLGGVLWGAWPGIALWVIGFFVGVELLMDGITVVMIGAAARRGPHSRARERAVSHREPSHREPSHREPLRGEPPRGEPPRGEPRPAT